MSTNIAIVPKIHQSTTNGFFTINFPKELFPLIYRYLESAKNVVYFAMASKHHFSLVTSDNPLWNSFLHNHFPDSYMNLKPVDESPFLLYKHLKITENNMKAGKCLLQTLNGHQNPVKTIILNGTQLISGSRDNTIKFWDIETGRKLKTLKGHLDNICCIVIYGDQLISGSKDNTIKFWDIETGRELRTLTGHRDEVTSLAVYKNQLISGAEDNTIGFWDIETGRELKKLNEHEAGVTSIVICNGQLISGSRDNTIKFWDLESGQVLQTLNGHQDAITNLVVHDNQLISSSYDNTIRVWDIKSRQEMKTLRANDGGVVGNIAVYDGKLFSSSLNAIKIWDLKSGLELQTLTGHYSDISCILFCKGKLFCGLWDATIKILNFTPLSLSSNSEEDLEQTQLYVMHGIDEDALLAELETATNELHAQT